MTTPYEKEVINAISNIQSWIVLDNFLTNDYPLYLIKNLLVYLVIAMISLKLTSLVGKGMLRKIIKVLSRKLDDGKNNG